MHNSTNNAFSQPIATANDLINWVNCTLHSEFNDITELRTGAAYCQFMDMLFPQAMVPMRHVQFSTLDKSAFERNWKIVNMALRAVGMKKSKNLSELIDGNVIEHLNFLEWFKHFFDANYIGHPYDPVAERNGMPMCYAKSFTPVERTILENSENVAEASKNLHSEKLEKLRLNVLQLQEQNEDAERIIAAMDYKRMNSMDTLNRIEHIIKKMDGKDTTFMSKLNEMLKNYNPPELIPFPVTIEFPKKKEEASEKDESSTK